MFRTSELRVAGSSKRHCHVPFLVPQRIGHNATCVACVFCCERPTAGGEDNKAIALLPRVRKALLVVMLMDTSPIWFQYAPPPGG
jgi:hypothetical protein